MKNRIYHYKTWQSDVVENSGQDYQLPKDYNWIPDDTASRIKSRVLYRIATIFTFFYAKLVWNLKIVGREKLKAVKGKGYFIYGNHTQPFGDVCLPVKINRPTRIYTIVSQSNYGIPVIGKLLPYLGALPIPGQLKNMKKLVEAINQRYQENHCIVIFPEAHVWPYYTKIRPFSTAGFHYPADLRAPVFAMTTTYQKRKLLKRPRITVYIDGPFLPLEGKSPRELAAWYHQQVTASMEERSRNSNVEFCTYQGDEQ